MMDASDVKRMNALQKENDDLRAKLAAADPDDCYHSALPGEPRFTMLARDPIFYELVMLWADRRMAAVSCGERPDEDMARAVSAMQTAVEGAQWRKAHNGEWRQPSRPDAVEQKIVGTNVTFTD